MNSKRIKLDNSGGDIDDDNQCSICKERISDEIHLGCISMHSYCFQCIKDWYIQKKELSCPECRFISEGFIIKKNTQDMCSPELVDFLDSMKILPHPKNHKKNCKCTENSSFFGIWALTLYINNSDQLKIYKAASKKVDEKILLDNIKWNLSPTPINNNTTNTLNPIINPLNIIQTPNFTEIMDQLMGFNREGRF